MRIWRRELLIAVILSDYQPRSGAASWWQRARRYVLIFKRGPESSLLLVFPLCSPHQHMSPLHTSATGGGQ